MTFVADCQDLSLLLGKSVRMLAPPPYMPMVMGHGIVYGVSLPGTTPAFCVKWIAGGVGYYTVANCSFAIVADAQDSTPPTLRNPETPPLACAKCKDVAPMAEANQPDGTFVCWRCRRGHS